jgi:hypothetical protein
MKKQKLYTEIGNMKNNHILYLIKLNNEIESFCKIGVTSKSIEERLEWIDEYDIEIISTITSDGYTIRGLESILKEKILDFNKHYKPISKIGGYTECYDIDYLQTIKSAFTYLEKTLSKDIVKDIVKVTPKEKSSFEHLGEDFQRKVIANIVNDKDFAEKIIFILNPNYFSNEHLKEIFNCIKCEKENRDILLDYIELEQFLWDVRDNEYWIKIKCWELRQIRSITLIDTLIIQETTLQFCKQQELLKAITEVQKIISRGKLEDYEVCERILKHTLEL